MPDDPSAPTTSSGASPPLASLHVRRPLWFALAIAVHLGLLALVLQRRLDLFFNDAAHRLGPATDFRAYVVAARYHAAGETMYRRGPGFGFRYHPLFVVATAPVFAHVPLEVSFALWVLLDELALAALLWLTTRAIANAQARDGFVIAALLFAPYYLEAYMGNATFIACALAAFAFAAEHRGRRLAFVTTWLASLLVKPIALVFVPWFLFRRRFAPVAAFLVLGVGSAAVWFGTHRVDWVGFRAVNLGETVAPGWVVHAGQQGLHGALAALLARTTGHPTAQLGSLAELPTGARAALHALTIAVAVASVATMYRLRREHTALGLFLGLAAYLLGYKDVWEHSYTALMVAIPALYLAQLIPTRRLVVCAIASALPNLFVFYDVALGRGPHDPEHHWGLAVSLLHHAWRPAWLLVLFVSAVMARRDRAIEVP